MVEVDSITLLFPGGRDISIYMIVSDFLRAQFLATKGTRHRITMDCLSA